MPTLLSQNFSLVQDRNAKSANTNTYTSSKSPSPIIEEDEGEAEEENNKIFIDDDTTIVDMTTLQQQSKSNTTHHLPITIPPPAHPKLGLKLQQSSPITSTTFIKPLSVATKAPSPATTTLSSSTSVPEVPSTPTIHYQKDQDQKDMIVSIPTISIWTAAEQGDIDTLSYYIQHHPNPVALLNKRDPKTECTLLHLAVSNSNSHRSNHTYATIDLLLTHGADPCARNVYNVQALHTIPLHCVESPEDSLVLLLNRGADVNCRDGDGWTPLHYAARFCRPASLGPMLTLLVQRGADLAAIDASKKTAMFALLANGDHVDAFVYLIRQQQQKGSSGGGGGGGTSMLVMMMLQARGEFLDAATRRTHRGTIVLQAAKYLRVGCLEWLLHSQQTMDQILPVLTQNELSYAMKLVQQQEQQQQQQDQHKCQEIMSLLHKVSTMLEKSSALSPSTVTHAIQRRFSIISTKRKDHRRHTLSSSPTPPHRDQDVDYDDETFLMNSPNLIKRMTNFFTRYKRPIVVQEQVV